MLKEVVIENISNTGLPISIDWSRCLRMRFNKNNCSKCIEQCRTDAIMISEGIDIKRDACSECMMCVSECPLGCFSIKNMDFYSLIAKLKKIENSVSVPVLGCNTRPDLKAHERTSCLGFLSEEHILALFVYLYSLQINLTGCSDCKNGFIIGILKKRINTIRKNTSINIEDKIVLIENQSELKYDDILYDRREFFRVLRNRTFTQAAELFENKVPDYITEGYSIKRLPLRRELLNRLHGYFSESSRKKLNAYYFEAYINEKCNSCFACVSMCPTGALKTNTNGLYPKLIFDSMFCSGCGLCEGFCMSDAIFIKKKN